MSVWPITFLMGVFLGLSGVYGDSKVALIIQDSDQVKPYCISIKSPKNNLIELMQQSGIRIQASSMGSVCQIEKVGCSINQCFCHCDLKGCRYWALYLKETGQAEWIYSHKGAHSIRPVSGQIYAWIWSEGTSGQTLNKPKPVSYEDICD